MKRLAPLVLLLPAGCLAPSLRPVAEDLYHHRLPGEGTPLVVPGAAWLEADLTHFLPERERLFYDLRGRGRSRPIAPDAGLTLEDDVADLEALRIELGYERFDLLGWGYAGGVALRYALAHPERVVRLLLVSPLPPRYTPYWPAYERELQERLDAESLAELTGWRTSGRKAQDPAGYARAFTSVSLATFCFDPAHAVRVRSAPYGSGNDPDRVARLKEAIFEALGSWRWDASELRELSAPTLIVHGREDPLPLAASREYVKLLPQARLQAIPSCGRLPWIERPEHFGPVATAFLEGVPLSELELLPDPADE